MRWGEREEKGKGAFLFGPRKKKGERRREGRVVEPRKTAGERLCDYGWMQGKG